MPDTPERLMQQSNFHIALLLLAIYHAPHLPEDKLIPTLWYIVIMYALIDLAPKLFWLFHRWVRRFG